LHKNTKAKQFFEKKMEVILSEVERVRKKHPRKSARSIYEEMKVNKEFEVALDGIGRDKFEAMIFSQGLKLVRKVRYSRTTIRGAIVFPNLIRGKIISNIDQVWMSDITYYSVLSEHFYITTVIDVYSRKLIGWNVSKTLKAEQTTIAALHGALHVRAKATYRNLIFHSDAGGQYSDKEFLKLLKMFNIKSSMAETVYENPFIERLHSTIKNDYLVPWGVNTFNQLKKKTAVVQYLYNCERPHQKLNKMTPERFEKYILKLRKSQRPKLKIKKTERNNELITSFACVAGNAKTQRTSRILNG
jgi:putative transposase